MKINIQKEVYNEHFLISEPMPRLFQIESIEDTDGTIVNDKVTGFFNMFFYDKLFYVLESSLSSSGRLNYGGARYFRGPLFEEEDGMTLDVKAYEYIIFMEFWCVISLDSVFYYEILIELVKTNIQFIEKYNIVSTGLITQESVELLRSYLPLLELALKEEHLNYPNVVRTKTKEFEWDV